MKPILKALARVFRRKRQAPWRDYGGLPPLPPAPPVDPAKAEDERMVRLREDWG